MGAYEAARVSKKSRDKQVSLSLSRCVCVCVCNFEFVQEIYKTWKRQMSPCRAGLRLHGD